MSELFPVTGDDNIWLCLGMFVEVFIFALVLGFFIFIDDVK